MSVVVLSDTALRELDALRTTAENTFDAQTNNGANILDVITVSTQAVPLSVLCYAYYGHTDYLSLIIDLNDIKDNAFVTGDIQILQEVSSD